jgi:hypothetical protein
MTPQLFVKLATATINCQLAQGSTPCDTGLPVVQSTQLTTIFQYLFGTIGAIAVLIIVIAGLRFILANGDPQNVAKARNTIIYAGVGLVVAVSAEIIVTFVLNNV